MDWALDAPSSATPPQQKDSAEETPYDTDGHKGENRVDWYRPIQLMMDR